jgi:archaellum biogenesis ATPase FlaH
MERTTEWILDAALDYAAVGYSVIPVRPDKTPYTPHGLKDATYDPDTIRKWWETWPDANVAIACGKVSGNLVVLDVDMKNGKNGKRSIEIWEAEHGDFPETVMANTPSGGQHYFFRVEDPSQYKNTVEALVGVDIRGDGAYVLVYPSGVGGDGKMYTWRHGVSCTETAEVADANESVLELLRKNSRDSKPQDAAKRQRVDMHHVPEGQRNDTLFRFASKMVGSGISRDAALEGARAEVATWDNPLPDFEIVKTVDSAYNSYQPNEETIYGDVRQEIDENGEYIPRLPAELTREFLLNPPPKKRPIIMNYLREGEAMLLSGNPKAGKSFLIVQLAIAIATGMKWIGVTCQKKPVLYIDGELSPEMTGERIKDIRERMGVNYLPEDLHIINTKNVDGVTLRDVADDFAHGIRKEEVVIIDPLYMFLKGSDENDNSQMKKEMEQIKRISATGTAVIVVHHMSKGIQSGKMSIDRASGAGVLGRFFDSILTLNLLNKEPTDPARPERVEADTRSFQQPRPVNLWFDGFHVVDGSGDLAGRDLNDPKKSTLEQKAANDTGRINHCYHWMKENCVLQPDGSFTLADMMDAYQNCWGKSVARTTLDGQLDRAGYIKSQKMIEVTIGDKVTKRMKNVYVPDGHEIKE